MKVEIQEVDSCSKKIKLEIPLQTYRDRVDAYIRHVARDVKIPGFRKGKAPASFLEKQIGKEAKREALNQLIADSITQVLEERKINASGPPTFLEVQAEEGTDISVSATVEVFPEIALQDYSGIEVDMKIAKITDEDVSKTIDLYRDRQAKNVPAADRPAQDQDFLRIDFRGTVDGKPFPGNEGRGHLIQVGAKRFLAGFEENLVGMNTGDVRDIKVSVPENYPLKEIAGKTVDFQVTVHSIMVRQLPEVNDEFAKSADLDKKFESVEDMQKKIRDLLDEEARRVAKKAAKKQLSEKLADMNPFDLPQGLIKEQIRFMIEQIESKAGHAHDHDHDHEHGEHVVTPEEEKQYRASAIKILQQELIVGKLAQDLSVDIDEKELNKEMGNFLAMMGGNANKMRKEWQKDGTLERLRVRMIKDKTLEALLGKIKVHEEMVDRARIIADN